MTQAYRVTMTIDGRETLVFPRSRKTTLFPSMQAGIKALDAKSRTLSCNAIGRIYEIDHAAENGRRLVYNMAL